VSNNGAEAKVYVILGSHACRTGTLMVEHKRIPYRTVTLPSGLHPLILRVRGLSENRGTVRRVDDRRPRALARADRLGTVPLLRMNGRSVQTNREIARFLDRVHPDPPLLPAEPGRRHEVEAAELWGDEVFQMATRRIVLTAALHGPNALFDRGGDGRLGPLLWRNDLIRLIGARMLGRMAFRASERAEAELLASVPSMLDRVDGWIEAGVLNGDHLNAADFMVVTSLALLTYRRDLRPEVEGRPSGRLVDRVLPQPSR
jgi:glutathione S-transferase